MRRKFTVYGLRFSKTSFWNHINTGFPDPAVATALTACGIETLLCFKLKVAIAELQQHLPPAVLKQNFIKHIFFDSIHIVATALTACGIETLHYHLYQLHDLRCNSTYRLRY